MNLCIDWNHICQVKIGWKFAYTKETMEQCVFVGIFVCNQSGNHFKNNLAKYGYKPNMVLQ
jgi:hypothetical protein